MNRDELIAQVKHEYQQRAERESQWVGGKQSTAALTPEAYYEKILGQVISAIEAGKFDQFETAREIVDAVELEPHIWL